MMRQFAIITCAMGLSGWGLASDCHAAKWVEEAHSYMTGSPDYEFRITIWYRVGYHYVTYDVIGDDIYETPYHGPTQVDYYWRWDRHQHQIDFGDFAPDNVWGVVESRPLGGTWYPVGQRQYELVP